MRTACPLSTCVSARADTRETASPAPVAPSSFIHLRCERVLDEEESLSRTEGREVRQHPGRLYLLPPRSRRPTVHQRWRFCLEKDPCRPRGLLLWRLWTARCLSQGEMSVHARLHRGPSQQMCRYSCIAFANSDINECLVDGVCKGVGEWCVNRLGDHLCCDPNSKVTQSLSQ